MPELYKPGSDNSPAGKYQEVNNSGESVSVSREVTIQEGDRLPPTQSTGNMWIKTS